jgi:hypothetical protein
VCEGPYRGVRAAIHLASALAPASSQQATTSFLEENATTTTILRTTMNKLPPELIDAIIGHVYEEYVKNGRSHLLACSLVCRLWRPFSQSRLLHHINFRWCVGSAGDAKIRRLDQTLLNSPHLASYIRVLELPDMDSCRLSTHLGHHSRPDWIGVDKSLSPL